MNALIVLSLVVAVANAQLVPSLLPYTHNLLHTTAFRTVAGAPFYYNGAVPLPAIAPAPVAYTSAAVAPAVIGPTTRTSQYHSQDEFGQYSFGYTGGPSSRNEVRDAFGVVRGSYNYIDANGKLQHQSYIADALGFRVAATNLPVAPTAGDATGRPGPEPVMETSEVAAARAAHQKAYEEAAAAAAMAPDTRRKRSVDLVAPEPVQDTAEVAQAKEDFQTLYNAAAAAADAAPDVGPLEGPFHTTYYGPYAPFSYNGLTPYTGLPFNYGILPYTGSAYAYPHNAYPYNFAFTN